MYQISKAMQGGMESDSRDPSSTTLAFYIFQSAKSLHDGKKAAERPEARATMHTSWGTTHLEFSLNGDPGDASDHTWQPVWPQLRTASLDAGGGILLRSHLRTTCV